jgi:hypothetical protein
LPYGQQNTSTFVVIGLACLLGSAVLAWLSSPATLRLTRDSETAAATIESRLFGMFVYGSARADGIRSASMLRSRAPGRDSHTPDRLVFETTKGPVDLGRNQQLFAANHDEIARFLQMDGPESLTLSSLARGREQVRFLVAQVIALAMFAAGLGLAWRVVRPNRG